MNTKVIIIRGLPGSGKSTMALKFFVDQKKYKHCEADHYFYNGETYEFNHAELNDAHEYCLNKALSFIEKGENVVISNTFSRRWEINEVIEKLPVDKRDITILHCYGGKGSVHNVPEFTIEKMKNRWQTINGEKHVTLDFSNKKPRIINHTTEVA